MFVNINRILLTGGLCAMLLSTGCSAAPINRYRVNNSTDGRHTVTRSLDGDYRSNRFGSPVGRGYNVRNVSRNNGSRRLGIVNEYTQGTNLNTQTANTERKIPDNLTPRAGQRHTTRNITNKGNVINKEEKIKPATNSDVTRSGSHTSQNKVTQGTAAKAHNVQRSARNTINKEEKKKPAISAAVTKSRSHTSQHQVNKETAAKTHNAQRLNRAAATAKPNVTRSTPVQKAAGAEDFRVRQAIHSNNYIIGEDGMGSPLNPVPRVGFRTGNLGRNIVRRSNNGLAQRNRENGIFRRNLTINDDMNTAFTRNYHRANNSSGYVGNFNRGNGLVRDYRFNGLGYNEGFVRTDGFWGNDNATRHNRGNAMFVRDYYGYDDTIPDWNDNFRDDFVRFDRQGGFMRGRGLMGGFRGHRGPAFGNYRSNYVGL